MRSPLVSIIIPVYNAEKWLAHTLESALNQTWQNIEVFVIDDGSSDRSVEISQSYESEKLQVISQRNQGASAARNHGLSLAKGDYIQYLDADDLLSPNKISDQVQLLASSQANKLAICSTIHFLDGTDPTQGSCYDGLPFYLDSDDVLNWLIRLWGGEGERGMVQPAAWLVPRAVSDSVGPWNTNLSLDDDGEYFARVILASSGIRRSESALTYYRKYDQGSSLSRTNSQKGIWSGLKALNLKSGYLLGKTQDLRAKKAIAALYMDWAMTAYPLCPEVTHLALEKIETLAVPVEIPIFGGWRMQIMQQVLGWKKARWLSWKMQEAREYLHQMRATLITVEPTHSEG